MEEIRRRSQELTGRLYELVAGTPGLEVLTSRDTEQRGAQLSIYVPGHRPDLESQLSGAGLIVDYREDNLRGSQGGVIRLAPAPLYTTETEVEKAAELLLTTVTG